MISFLRTEIENLFRSSHSLWRQESDFSGFITNGLKCADGSCSYIHRSRNTHQGLPLPPIKSCNCDELKKATLGKSYHALRSSYFLTPLRFGYTQELKKKKAQNKAINNKKPFMKEKQAASD